MGEAFLVSGARTPHGRYGGAIALGHPRGSSGARILLTLLGRMEREKAKRGLATLCVGVGQGVSMLIEAP